MFDEVVNRKNTDCLKYDALEKRFGSSDLLPLWVADMDFTLPNEISQAIQQRANHNIFGYLKLDDKFFSAISNKYQNKNININEKNIIFSSSVVASLISSILSFSKIGDSILIQPPIYTPFFKVIKNHNRVIIENELSLINNRYEINFKDLEEKIKKIKIFLLCNPHNPTGRLFDKNELSKIINLCLKYNVILISDEIHSDIIYENKSFNSILSFEKAKDISIVLNSASKTYNIAGFHSSYVMSFNKTLLSKMKITLSKYHLNVPEIFGSKATVIGYEKCTYWVKNLIEYLQENRDFIIDFINKNIPLLNVIKPEATYLIWLDFNKYKISHQEIQDKLLKKTKLALNSGTDFGKIGNKFFRLNLATRREVLKEALKRIKKEFT
jgi:cystathionine beta-lyase